MGLPQPTIPAAIPCLLVGTGQHWGAFNAGWRVEGGWFLQKSAITLNIKAKPT